MKKLFLIALVSLFVNLTKAQVKPVDSWTDGKYVNINNAKLWVVTVGEGDPIIFIAGGPGGAHTGLRSFDALANGHHQLIYFDAFGRGKSDTAKNVTEYTLERDIDDIEGLRKALKLDKITVLGHSYGGVVAQGYAIKYPGHLSHLILADTFHSFVMWQENDDSSNREIKNSYPEVWDELMKVREQGAVSSDAIHQEIYGKVPYGFLYAYNPDKFASRGSKPYPNAYNSKLYYQMVGKDGDFIVGSDIGTFDYRKQLKDLKMPVLIVTGRYDRVAVPWMAVKFKEYCPQAQFVIFEKSGHNPQVEEPEKEFKIINEFLAK
ncbi:alpha/beta fold hydrolase [Mucilaginibacter corticis]|uniref:Alpha/beta fold hydrolase n=1 Tax=Mucilaginibacter corticis TaxID=2597670 RepID=A0A556MBR0_9SPHI|nr:alpha/beta hydrolase [Mucilaginibacter corticis]TSJ37302.1 alpha/beta fold hydrolase [Mucilaginibacter corticis]